MSKESNNNKNLDSSVKGDEEHCDRRPNVSDEGSVSTGESSSNNNDGTAEHTRREETPFSLKHFLKRDSNNEQHTQMTGARPKVPSNTPTSDSIKMKRSPKFSSFDSQASLASSLPQPSEVTNIGSNSFQSNRSFNMNSDSENILQKNKIQRSCSAYDQRPTSFPDSEKNTDMLSDALKDLFPNMMKNPNPENPSALPDFVQDHLLMEQFYYQETNRSPIVSPLSSSYTHQYDHQLPDFTMNDKDSGRNYSNNGDMPFDLMCNSNESNRNSSNRNPLILPLDLPIDLPITAGNSRSQISHQMHNNYQLDLTARTDGFPPGIDNLSNGRNSHFPGGGNSGVGENFQTLPDFLSDGHVHSTGRQSDILQETSPESELYNNDYILTSRSEMRAENARLKRELKNRNQLIGEQDRRLTELESTLAGIRHNENITQNMEEIVSNINRSVLRATAAQNLADEYKKQVLQLTAQIEELRQENEILKEEGAVGGSNVHSYHRRSTPQSQQVAKELLIAASTAETNLRQLLTGVENLRLLARKIDTIDNGLKNDYSDCEDDDFAGPAL